MDFEIYITLNNKADIEKVKEILMQLQIEKPIYVVELAGHYRINFDCDYQYFEIEERITAFLTDYEFVSDIGKGRKEIRMTIYRIQAPTSSNGWGQHFNTDAIESTVYLIRKNKSETSQDDEPNEKFIVLFGGVEREYTVNVVPGINRANDEKGYILVRNLEDEKPDLLIKRLFPNKSEAFWSGFNMLTKQVELDFEDYKQSTRRKKKKRE